MILERQPMSNEKMDANINLSLVVYRVMNTRLQNSEDSSIAAVVAPEDLRRGNFVAVLSEIIELPTFLWAETLSSGRGEMVRIRRLPTENRAPLKIKAICLPFVFVKRPNGQFQTID